MVKQRKSSLWVALFCFRISCDIVAVCGKDSIFKNFDGVAIYRFIDKMCILWYYKDWKETCG